MLSMDTLISYEKAVDHFGSASEMARRLDIRPQAIYQWGGVIPELRRYQIAEIIQADINAEEVA